MASIILTQPGSPGSGSYPGQREAGTLTPFDGAREGAGSSATRIAITRRRKATHVTHDDAPVLPGISPLTIGTMPRAEHDEATRAGSYAFHDRPGSGRHTADRLEHF